MAGREVMTSGSAEELPARPTGPTDFVQEVLRRANQRAAAIDRHATLLIVSLSAVYWAAAVVLAARKLMWNDELYTYYIARLPSMADVWMALVSGGEQTPPFFYVVTRAAFALFGTGHVAIRLPEILGVWAMSACLFVFVRRWAPAVPALCAAAFPLVTMASFYALDARPYGLVLGFGALALVSWQTATLERHRRLSIAVLAASLAAAVSTHYYGVLLVPPLALGELARTATRRRLDPAVWAALAMPLVPLALHLPLIRAGTAYASAFWAPPRWVNIPDFYAYLLGPAVVPVAVILVAAGTYALAAGGRGAVSRPPVAPPLHEVVAACGLVAIPVLAVLLAKTATGAFTHRYALTAVLGFAVLAGFGTAAASRRHPIIAIVTAAGLAGWFVLSQAREMVQPSGFSQVVSRQLVDRPDEWLAAFPNRRLPLVIADPHNFAVLSHYGSPAIRSRIVYLADPELALAHLGHNSVERGMLDLLGPSFGMEVVAFEPFVARHSEFLVYGDFVRLAFLNWIVPELQARGMRVELLNRAGDNLFLLVRREGRGAERPSAGSAGSDLP